jgi:glucoamylase
MPCFEERMLRTIAKLRDYFEIEKPYQINTDDARNDMGPSIGRYPGDTYDGETNDGDDIGHPWPLCTGNLARYYYQCMLEITARPSIQITENMRSFFGQIGFDYVGEISKASLQYKELLGALLTAGDRLMRAIVYHSDHLELSEQNNRNTGMCSSVRNLTWSYSSFLAASRTRREMAVNAI